MQFRSGGEGQQAGGELGALLQCRLFGLPPFRLPLTFGNDLRLLLLLLQGAAQCCQLPCPLRVDFLAEPPQRLLPFLFPVSQSVLIVMLQRLGLCAKGRGFLQGSFYVGLAASDGCQDGLV